MQQQTTIHNGALRTATRLDVLLKQDVVSLLFAASMFMGAFEYLFSIDIGGVEIRIFQILIISLFPLIALYKRSRIFFFLSNIVLGIGAYYSSINGYFDSTADMWKILMHQEMTVVSIAVFLSVDYGRLNLKMIFQANFWALLIGSCLGLVQFVLYNVFGFYINISKYDMGEHLKWRIFGFFSEPNMYSLYYVLALPMLYAYLQLYHKRNPLFRYVILSIVLLALFLSFSRGALLAVIWIAFNEMVKNKSKWFSIILVGGMVLFAMVFSAFMSASVTSNELLYRLTSFDVLKDPSSSGRLDVFVSLYNYYQTYGFGSVYTLLFGNGLSSFRAIAYPFDSDYNYFAMNLYVDLLFEHGLIAFIGIFVALFALNKKRKAVPLETARILGHVLPAFFILCLFYPMRTVMLYQVPFLFSVGFIFYVIKNSDVLTEQDSIEKSTQ